MKRRPRDRKGLDLGVTVEAPPELGFAFVDRVADGCRVALLKAMQTPRARGRSLLVRVIVELDAR
jgi:hypothetical protein